MKFALYLPNFGPFAFPQNVIQFARAAEEAGWDGFFLWDHIARSWSTPVGDPWILLAAVANSTKNIKLGAMVTPLARRRPWKFARETATLDHLSQGRLIAGIGLGSSGGKDVEWAHFGEEMNLKRRAQLLDEGMEIVRGLWSGEPFSFDGQAIQVSESQFLPTPYQRIEIPVWVAGSWPNKPPMRRAARWSGLFPLLQGQEDELEQFRAAVEYVNSHRQSAEPFDFVHLHNAIFDSKEAKELTQGFEEAGATWWIERVGPQDYGLSWTDEWPLEKMLERIKKGPLALE